MRYTSIAHCLVTINYMTLVDHHFNLLGALIQVSKLNINCFGQFFICIICKLMYQIHIHMCMCQKGRTQSQSLCYATVYLAAVSRRTRRCFAQCVLALLVHRRARPPNRNTKGHQYEQETDQTHELYIHLSQYLTVYLQTRSVTWGVWLGSGRSN